MRSSRHSALSALAQGSHVQQLLAVLAVAGADPADCPKIDHFGYTEWDERSAQCANRIYEVKRKRAGHHA